MSVSTLLTMFFKITALNVVCFGTRGEAQHVFDSELRGMIAGAQNVFDKLIGGNDYENHYSINNNDKPLSRNKFAKGFKPHNIQTHHTRKSSKSRTVTPSESDPDESEIENDNVGIQRLQRHHIHHEHNGKHEKRSSHKLSHSDKNGQSESENDNISRVMSKLDSDADIRWRDISDKELQKCMLDDTHGDGEQGYKVVLNNFQNVQYFGNITIGTKSETMEEEHFPAIYDTGSFELLVLSKLCSKCKSYSQIDTPLYTMDTVDFSYFPSEKVEQEVKRNVTKCLARLNAEGKEVASSDAHGAPIAISYLNKAPLKQQSQQIALLAGGHKRQLTGSDSSDHDFEYQDSNLSGTRISLDSELNSLTLSRIDTWMQTEMQKEGFIPPFWDDWFSSKSEKPMVTNEKTSRRSLSKRFGSSSHHMHDSHDSNSDHDSNALVSKHHHKHALSKKAIAEKARKTEYVRELREYLRQYLAKIGVDAETTPFECWPAWSEARHLFGSGPVVSVRGYDTVHFGDWRAENAPRLPWTPLWLVRNHEIDAWDNNAKFSAIAGLGPKSLVPLMDTNGEKVPTMLQRAGVNRFSICLKRLSPRQEKIMDEQNANGNTESSDDLPSGELIFNAPRASENPKQIRVVGLMHWAVKMSMFSSQKTSNTPDPKNYCMGGCAAIIDSGTSLIAAPTSVIDAISAEVNLSQNCEGIENLPNLEFRFGEDKFQKTFTLPPSAYVVKLTGQADTTSIFEWWMGNRKVENTVMCSLAFMPMDTADQKWGPVYIFGMNFLRYYKTTYVRENQHCPPKMYFNEVDHNCRNIPKGQVENAHAIEEEFEQASDSNGSAESAAGGGGSFLVQKDSSKGKQSMKAKYGTITVNGQTRARTKEEVTPLEIDPREIRYPDWNKRLKDYSL